MTPPAKDFYGKPVPIDLLKGFKPDNVNQYHQFLKAVMFGSHETARQIRASHSPGEWDRLGRVGIPKFNAGYWVHRGGRNYVEEFIKHSMQKAFRQPSMLARQHRTAFQQNLYNMYAMQPTARVAKPAAARRNPTPAKAAPKARTTSPTLLRPTWGSGTQRTSPQTWKLWMNSPVYRGAAQFKTAPPRQKATANKTVPVSFGARK